MGWLELGDQGVHQGVGFGRVVCAKVTDVHIQRNRTLLRPRVHAQVGLCQQDSGSDTTWPVGRARKSMKQMIDRPQPGGMHDCDATFAQPSRVL